MVRFEIAAPVYVSFQLKQLLRYPNVRIHQVVLSQTLDRLIDESIAMLDLSAQCDEELQRRYLAAGKPVLSLERPGYQNEPAQVYASVAALRQQVLELSAQLIAIASNAHFDARIKLVCRLKMGIFRFLKKFDIIVYLLLKDD